MKTQVKDVKYYLDTTRRDRLFRTFNKITRKWMIGHGDLLFWDNMRETLPRPFTLSHTLTEYFDPNLDSDAITMEWTGREDSVGTRIFELDIVHGDFPYAKHGVVTWDTKRCGFYIDPFKLDGRTGGSAAYDKGYKMSAAKLTVIGNVCDNPELIKI